MQAGLSAVSVCEVQYEVHALSSVLAHVAPCMCTASNSMLLCPLLQLVELFGSVRDEWIVLDLPSWLAANHIYEGVADPVREAMLQHQVYIVTTKQVSL